MNERKRKLFIILGIMLVVTPFLGIPSSWKTFVYVVLGLGIAFIAFFINKNCYFLNKPEEEILNKYSDKEDEERKETDNE